jgi:hypothetical protein
MSPRRPWAKHVTILSPDEAEIVARAVEGGLVGRWWDLPTPERTRHLAERAGALLGRVVRFPPSGWREDWEPVRLAVRFIGGFGMLVETGRTSCRNPPIQNIPRRG